MTQSLANQDRIQSQRLVRFVLFMVLIGLVAACTGFHTRLFEQSTDEITCRHDYCFVPRIVAYKDYFGEPPGMYDNGFWASIKLYDPTINAAKYLSSDSVRKVDLSERSRLSDAYKARVLSQMRMDSLVLSVEKDNLRIAAYPDTTLYEPRDVNYVSFSFGRVTVPFNVTKLDAVFHFTYNHESLSAGEAVQDSVRFVMNRVEEFSRLAGIEAMLGGHGDEDSTEAEE